MPDIAQDTAVDDLLSLGEVIPAPLLGADLDHTIRVLVRVVHRVDARDRVRRGLLDVHVLARGDRVHHDRRVRKIGRADEHGVDVVAIENAAVVGDHLQFERLPRRCQEALKLCRADLTPGQPFHVAVTREGVEHTSRPVAAADDGEPDAVVRALNACARRQRRGCRDAERANGGLQERATALHEGSLLRPRTIG